MTARLADIADCPEWPRGLSAEQAAAYVGVSAPKFLEDVAAGKWPPGRQDGRRVIWDKVLLDRYYDRHSGLDKSERRGLDRSIERLG